jgi:NAD(P)-dependent dehydrogenase (short-subunit alcohol dehydrogenase family)
MSSFPEAEFRGKRALLTGGTQGIGEAIVQRLRYRDVCQAFLHARLPAGTGTVVKGRRCLAT